MSTRFLLILASAAALGLAVAWLVRQLLPATPALAPAISRLHPDTAIVHIHPARLRAQAVVGSLVPEADLAILGLTRSAYLAKLGRTAGISLGLVLIIGVVLAAAGMGLALTLPAVTGFGFAAITVLATYRSVRRDAARLRAEYHRGVCIYLDQVASILAAGQGPTAAMALATRHLHGGVFDTIRAALKQARNDTKPPWDQLRELGRQIGVPALSDLGENMAATEDGAKVYEALRQTTSALRSEIRYDKVAAAGSGSTGLEALSGAIVLILVLIIAYPFIGPMIGN